MIKNKSIFTVLSVAILTTLCSFHASAQKMIGADVSWCTEMENEGKTFCDASGNSRELMQVLHGIGMSAVRLRVWVNPSYSTTPSQKCYGSAYCDCADVVAKAKRAKAAGMDVMIDFHYSDFFADPGRQAVPNDWEGLTFDQIKDMIYNHTTTVLNSLKSEGITPRWIQIGNETASGMLNGYGDITWNPTNFKNFVTLYNVGYDAAKTVCPDAYVMPHKNQGSSDNIWWFDAFKAAGGKMDMIALSHYPQTDDTSKSPQTLNSNLASQIKTMGSKYNVPVMISEVGVRVNNNETTASQVLQDLLTKVSSLSACAGIFYWEPQLYGWWKPQAYNSLGWNAYDMGAFYSNGAPSKALTDFVQKATGIKDVVGGDSSSDTSWYNTSGQRIAFPTTGIYLHEGKKILITQ